MSVFGIIISSSSHVLWTSPAAPTARLWSLASLTRSRLRGSVLSASARQAAAAVPAVLPAQRLSCREPWTSWWPSRAQLAEAWPPCTCLHAQVPTQRGCGRQTGAAKGRRPRHERRSHLPKLSPQQQLEERRRECTPRVTPRCARSAFPATPSSSTCLAAW